MKKTYYISIVKKDGFEWGLMESLDYDYIEKIFNLMAIPPEYSYMELRGTTEDIDTHLNYDVYKIKTN